ncbi:putative mitochondrial protein AtMg01250 [Bidens hawaiensis]|uniref:putative mitochondrial protein AtMg01250 n=1 Tax=Bidens hawaiensis TaxID=980011 RepID=UPI00404A894D
MEKMGEGILKASWASVLVNGSPTPEFLCTRGLRQRVPLSPFLFVIAMEGLSCLIKKAVRSGAFKGLQCGVGGPLLSHLLYADDAIIIGEWNRANAQNLKRLLRCFSLVSGLKVNQTKCQIFGTEVGEVELGEVASDLGCKVGKVPFIYLGLHVGVNMNRINAWGPIIEVFKKKAIFVES